MTRYDDVNMVLRDQRFAKNRYSTRMPEQLRKMPWVPPMFKPLERNMLDLDAPDHTRLRALVQKAFSPRLIEQMRERIRSLADELMEGGARKREMDLIRSYALPLRIITEILGVPAGGRDKFHRWLKLIVSIDQFKIPWGVVRAVWKFNRYLRSFFKSAESGPPGRSDDGVAAGGRSRRQAE